jgi:hypothetical protein
MIVMQAAATARVSHIGNAEANQEEKLIRKLRWIGLDDEAARLELALRSLAPEMRGTVCADPRSTD